MQSAGVHRARVSHLVGAPCGTTALAGLHRLMPVLVPAVVPLMPSNKANESSLHGAAFPTEPTLRRQHPVYTTKRAHEQDGLWLSPRMLTKLLTNRFDLKRSSWYSGGRSLRSAQLPNVGGSWLTRRGSTGPTPLPPLIGSRLAACPRALRCSRPRSGQLRRHAHYRAACDAAR
jgi:hypothetical protein